MADENKINTTVDSLLKSMDSMISAKTVVGDAVNINGTTIIPLVDVSFGIGTGCMDGEKKSQAAGGLGGKISPNAVLIIKDNQIKLVNVKNQDAFTKIIDMIPDIVNKFTGKNPDATQDPQVQQAVKDASK